MDWNVIDQATLDLAGTDVATAVAGRVPLDGHTCRLVLARVVAGGWREIYDGPAPEIGYEPGEPRPRCLVIGAPESDARDSWVLVTFLEQHEGGWSTMGSPGVTPYEDD